MRLIAISVTCLVAVAACTPAPDITLTTKATATTSQDQAALASGLASRMKDPSSVQYRGIRSFVTSGNQRIICGEYNAKNSFGAYTGFEPFLVRTYEDQPVSTLAADNNTYMATVIGEMCKGAAVGKMKVYEV